MTGVETAATAIKLGLELIERAAPSGLALVKSIVRGKELIVIGPKAAGKSTFIDFLHYGLFEPEKEHISTLSVDRSARFDVKMGKNSALELSVRSVTDVPGQFGGQAHADIVFDRRPHAIIAVFDLTRPHTGPESSIEWLNSFVRRLDSRWRASQRRNNRLKACIILLNKSDKVGKDYVESVRKVVRQTLDEQFRDGRGRMKHEVIIVPTVLVDNPDGSKSAETVVANLAKLLTN